MLFRKKTRYDPNENLIIIIFRRKCLRRLTEPESILQSIESAEVLVLQRQACSLGEIRWRPSKTVKSD